MILIPAVAAAAVTIVGILPLVAQVSATSRNTSTKMKPCHFKYPEAEAISSQLRLLTEMYLGYASLYSESVLGFRDVPRRPECEPELFFTISSNIRAIMARSWKMALDPAEPDESAIEEITTRLNNLAAKVNKLTFTNRYSELYSLKPSVLLESFEIGLRRIKAVAEGRKKAEEEKNAITTYYQQIQANLSTVLDKLENGRRETANVPGDPTTSSTTISISTSTESPVPSTTSTPETIPITTTPTEDPTPATTLIPPAFNMDVRTRQTIQTAYPACSNPSDLTKDSRLNNAFALVYDPLYEGYSEPAIYNVLLDAILSSSPLVCTQDYVRLAHRVKSREEEDSTAENKPNWAWLRARFQPAVFQLLDSAKTKVMSVSQPGFALSATTTRIRESRPGNFAVVLKPLASSDVPPTSFEFRFYSQSLSDGGYLLVENHLTNTYFHLFHMRRWVDANAHLVILPTEEFVLGKTTALQFRIARKDGPVCKVAPPGSGFWKLGDRLERGSYLLASATESDMSSPETLFYLA